MHVISKKSLSNFWEKHAKSRDSLLAWHKVAENCTARNFTELKETFGTADYVPDKFTVFDVGGNNFRVIAVIYYTTQKMYIRGVFTHLEYNKWTKDNRGK